MIVRADRPGSDTPPDIIAGDNRSGTAGRGNPLNTIGGDAFWSGVEAVGTALLSVVSAFLIARMIGPGELGTGAAAVAVNVLLWVGVNSLFADALVQRDHIGTLLLSSAYWASAAAGAMAGVVQAGSGWLLAALLGDSRLIPMALLLALPLPFVGAGGALLGKLTRERRYRAMALRTLAGQGTGAALGLYLAIAGTGAWAPVAQQAAGSLTGAIALAVAAGWWPRPVCHWRHVVALCRVGVPLTASTFVQIARYRVFAVLIGATAGASALGLIHVAFRLADTARDVVFTATWRLFLPILSRHKHDHAALLAQVDGLGRIGCAVVLPLCGLMALTVAPLTVLVLGTEWATAGQAAIPLAGLMAWQMLTHPAGVAVAARGQARFTLYANLISLAATMLAVPLIGPDTPWSAVMVWCGAQLVVSPYTLWVNGRVLGADPWLPWRSGLPMAAVTALALTIAWRVPGDGAAAALVGRPLVFAAIAGAGVLFLSRRNLTRGTGAPSPAPTRELPPEPVRDLARKPARSAAARAANELLSAGARRGPSTTCRHIPRSPLRFGARSFR